MEYAVSLSLFQAGALPLQPRSLSLWGAPDGHKRKGKVDALPIRLLAHLGAQVALQQSLILRVGRESIANLFPKWDGSMITNQTR